MNMKVEEVARLMNKSPQFVRIGLQRGLLPFGTAKKNRGGRYSYYISPELFEQYTGIKLRSEENKERTKVNEMKNNEIQKESNEIIVNKTVLELKQDLINLIDKKVGYLENYKTEVDLLKFIIENENK